MRFGLSNSTPPHLNGRLQLRMLGFVGFVALLMLFMATIQPKPKADVPLPGQPDQAVYDVNDGTSEPLKDGEFISEKWQEPPPLPDKPRDNYEEDLAQEIGRREAQFDKSILRRVKDNTLGVRREEGEAYYRLLDHARHVPTEALERTGARDVLYINLMTQPDRFRGEPITIQGDLWRLYEFPAGPNPYGLKTLYEGWIFTGDSSNHPYRVVFTHLPKELEPGDNLRRPVKTTGYFFKREGYASSGGMHVAPTLLAKRVDSYRSPNSMPSADAMVPYMIGVITAVGLAFMVTLVSFVIRDRRAAREALLHEMNAPWPSFDGIAARPFISVQDSLRQLEDKDWQADADAVDEPYEEVSALLHARDRVRTEKEPAEPLKPTSEELADQRQKAVEAVQAWTSQHNSKNETVLPPVVQEIPSPQADESHDKPDADSPAASDGLSKMAAWESEIQQLQAQRKPAPQLTADQRAALEDLDRDEKLREEELNNRLRQERAELDQQQRVLDAAEQESLDDESFDSDRRTFNLPSRHDERDDLNPPHDHLTIDRAARDELSDDDDSADEDDEDEGPSNRRSSGNQKRSSRRQRRRDR